jgi:hypothetical protein
VDSLDGCDHDEDRRLRSGWWRDGESRESVHVHGDADAHQRWFRGLVRELRVRPQPGNVHALYYRDAYERWFVVGSVRNQGALPGSDDATRSDRCGDDTVPVLPAHEWFERVVPHAAGGTANLGVQTSASANLHHLTIQNCMFTGLQGNPVEFSSCDYVRFIRNTVFACGKRQPGSDVPNSTSSGCTINAKSAPYSFDAGTGFHNVIAYNVIAGMVGPTTDGNGIILDNGGTATQYQIGNTLIIRNIVYGCGGRGIHVFRTTAQDGHWVIGNLCHKNGLDRTLTANSTGAGDEFDVQQGGPSYLVNNIAVPWTGTGGSAGYGTTAFRDANGSGSTYTLSRNKRVTGGLSSNPLTGGAGLIDNITDPGFIAGLSYDPNTVTDPYTVPDPRLIGPAFDIKGSSVLKDAGIDPRVMAQMTAQMQIDVAPYLLIDEAGRQAPF